MYCSLKAYYTTLSPPLFKRSHFCRQVPARPDDARDPSSERWNCVGQNYPVILPKWLLPRHLGIFYMPQIYNMGLTALLPLQRKVCWGFFCPEKSWWLRPGLNPQTWVLKGSTLPLDHRSRSLWFDLVWFDLQVFRVKRAVCVHCSTSSCSDTVILYTKSW